MRILLLALLLVPVASACSLESMPPLPAAFILWDPDTGETQPFEVEKRGLGADCTLSNWFAIGAGQFAWVESRTIHVANLTTGETETIYWSDGMQGIGLVDAGLLVQTISGKHPNYAEAYHLVNGHESEVVQQQAGGRHDLNGGVIYRSWEDAPVQDVMSRTILVDTTNASRLGWTGEEIHFRGANPTHLFYEMFDGGALIVYEIGAGAFTEIELPGYYWRYGNDRVVSGDGDGMYVLELDSLEVRTFERPPLDVLGAGDGWIVLGAFSIEHLDDDWRPPFEIRPDPLDEWVPAPFALMGVLLAFALRRK